MATAKGKAKKVPASGQDAQKSAAAPGPAESKAVSNRTKQVSPPILPSRPLTRCPNRHWRYISMFHGPWLQVPVEQLAHVVRANLQHPRPHPYDPAVLQDALRVRRAVDDATDLAVRAASGLVSAPFSSRRRAAPGRARRAPAEAGARAAGTARATRSGSAGAAAAARPRGSAASASSACATWRPSGWRRRTAATRSPPAWPRCSRRRASTTWPLHVLRRNAQDLDALYVHFFHEKIPSREVARCTPLDVLDQLILERPNDPAAYRTRALTKMFKDDHEGAMEDLTRGLAMCRLFGPLHDKRDLKDDEVDPQRGLEPQMLFHRANCYLHSGVQAHQRLLGPLAHSTRDGQTLGGENGSGEKGCGGGKARRQRGSEGRGGQNEADGRGGAVQNREEVRRPVPS